MGFRSTPDSQLSSVKNNYQYSDKIRKNYSWIITCHSHLDTAAFFFEFVCLAELGFHLCLIGLVVGSFDLNNVLVEQIFHIGLNKVDNLLSILIDWARKFVTNQIARRLVLSPR